MLTDSDKRGDREILSSDHRNKQGELALHVRVLHAVCQLPIQVDDVAVYVEEREGTPCSGPIERAEGELKLVDAVRLDHVLREEV